MQKAQFKLDRIYEPYQIDDDQDMYVALIDFLPDLVMEHSGANYFHAGKIQVCDMTREGCAKIAQEVISHLNELIHYKKSLLENGDN